MSSDLKPRRLYLDNASTSFPKPPSVIEAMSRFAAELGTSAGRSGYDEAAAAGSILSDCRRALAKLLNAERPEHFVFTLNGTEALNLAIKGLIDPTTDEDDHAICSAIDHNSILRPLAALEARRATEVTRLAVDPKSGLIDLDELRRSVRAETKLIAITHVSNVSGTMQPLAEISAIARENEVPLLVDAAQSAGHVPIDLLRDHIDLLAMPGHKGLLGPLGTGVLYVRPGLETKLRPLVEGGTGSSSDDPNQPTSMPDRFEAGSHNVIGIAGLLAGVKWILEQTVEKLWLHEQDLVRTFIDGASDVAGLRYLGPQGIAKRGGVFSVRIDGLDPHELATILETHYGVLTRAGLHCAPLAHRAFGTFETGGATRLSFGPFLSKQDVLFATDALAQIVMSSAIS